MTLSCRVGSRRYRKSINQIPRGEDGKKIYLIEDHDEALRVWREKKAKDLDLVHLDAHIDFGFYQATPIEQVFKEAKSLRELKKSLEKSLVFGRYEKDFNKQTSIGNYIYPAMCEGMVKDFYWVVPGGLKEFKAAYKIIKNTLKYLVKQGTHQLDCRPQTTDYSLKEGIISTRIFGRKFIICTLEKLPILKQKVLLDIDTDFLVIDSLLNANHTKNIGERKPWIFPEDLVKILKKKIEQPEVITIAYSVNGGFTPIKYKHLGDEIAYRISPKDFKDRFKLSSRAGEYFELFSLTGKKQDYEKAINLDPSYRVCDNNYGSLYLRLGKLSEAEGEFQRIIKIDAQNLACFWGLGSIALERKDFKRAKQYFTSVLKSRNHKLFAKAKNRSLWGLAKAELSLKNFDRAKVLLSRYRTLKPLYPQSYYLLGRIYEKENKFPEAVEQYQDAVKLGLNDIDLLHRLLKISYHLKNAHDIIKFVLIRYNEFKKHFRRTQRINLKKEKQDKSLDRIEDKIKVVGRMLDEIRRNKSKACS